MNQKGYKRFIYFIGITILLTIAVQVYWNVREYRINKYQLISKVRRSLDHAVEDYYANLTRSGFITFDPVDLLDDTNKPDTIRVETKSRRGLRKMIDSTLSNIAKQDSAHLIVMGDYHRGDPDIFFARNSARQMDSLIQKIVVSITRDSLNLEKLNEYVSAEFDRNNIAVDYALTFQFSQRVSRDSVHRNKIEFNTENIPEDHLTVSSKSNYLPFRSTLQINFTNDTAFVLRESFISIFLSFLLSASIIISILYLFRTIFKQKQLAAVKNDLISNITHEFKTPIATIGAALDALKNFNALEDKKKSEKYIKMSHEQVHKLHQMVEKLLETATLNQGDLPLDKEGVNLGDLIHEVVGKYELLAPKKKFIIDDSLGEVILQLDKFHFENAIGNIIDNAIKYGGKEIHVIMKQRKDTHVIRITDNGNGIHKSQKDKVFEQFYRIPTGNTHNVKGFGIGLYYTKKIIEKHGGVIAIKYDKKDNTFFEIIIPNA